MARPAGQSSAWLARLLRLARGSSVPAVNLIGWTLFAASVLVLLAQLADVVEPQDEGELLTYPWLITHGAMPYRDIWMMYPPATYLLLAGLFKLGVPGLLAERGLGILVRLIYVLLVNRALTGSWRRFSWLGIGLSFIPMVLGADVRAYPFLVGLPLFLLGLLCMRRHPARACLLFVLAGTFRLDLGLAGIGGVAALAALDALWRRPSWPMSVRIALLGAVGLGAFYAGLDWLTAGAAWDQIVVQPVTLVEPLQRLPLWPPAGSVLGAPVELLLLAGPPALILAGLWLRNAYLAAGNLAVMVLVSHFLQRADVSHLFSTAAIVLPWMLISLTRLASDRGPDLSRQHDRGNGRGGPALGPAPTEASLRSCGRASRSSSAEEREVRVAAVGLSALIAVAGWCAIIFLGYAVYISSLSPLSSSPFWSVSPRLVQAGGNAIVASSAADARDDRQVVAFVRDHASPGDRVFITPRSLRYRIYTRTDLYYLLQLRPATQYLEMEGYVETQPAVQQKIVGQLHSCRWVVLMRGGDWYWSYPAPIGSALLERYIARHYRAVLQNRTYQVLVSLD